VSGGPGSLVDYDTLSREGRRFVNFRVKAADRPDEVAQEPVRVFIGLDSAATTEERVDLALAELERLGGFSKSHLLAVCPAGSGYANSVPVEALEFYCNGDVASVVVQYGVLPSMLSLDEVPQAAAMFRLLIDRLQQRIDERQRDDAQASGRSAPLLHLYGESLGARIAQEAIAADPPLADVAAATLRGIRSVLFVGTPGGTGLRDVLADHPQVVHVDRWQDLPQHPPAGCQFWFLDHDADPVTRFELPLVRRRPVWLANQPRGRNIPARMRWWPVLTWQQVMLDVAYATQAQSGVFRSLGHDYRADLPDLVAAAFASTGPGEAPTAQQIEAVKEALADREIKRDQLLTQAEAQADR
jgi:uncharacterized membrane protein